MTGPEQPLAGLWPWTRAVQQLVTDDGVLATAWAWASYAVVWPAGGQQPVEEPLGVLDLARLRRRHRVTIERHLAKLVRLGLLRQARKASPFSKARYEAVLPPALRDAPVRHEGGAAAAARDAAVQHGRSARDAPVQHERDAPALHVPGSRDAPAQHVPARRDAPAQHVPARRDAPVQHERDAPALHGPYLQNSTETPSPFPPSAAAAGAARHGAGGRAATTPGHSAGDLAGEVAGALLAAVPAGVPDRAATAQQAARLRELAAAALEQGLELDELRELVTGPSWRGVQHGALTLVHRLDDLLGPGGRVLRGQRARERAAQAAATARTGASAARAADEAEIAAQAAAEGRAWREALLAAAGESWPALREQVLDDHQVAAFARSGHRGDSAAAVLLREQAEAAGYGPGEAAAFLTARAGAARDLTPAANR